MRHVHRAVRDPNYEGEEGKVSRQRNQETVHFRVKRKFLKYRLKSKGRFAYGGKL